MKAIVTKLLPATLHKPTRIVAKDEDGNRIITTTPDTFTPNGDHHLQAAEILCKKMKWTGELVQGSIGPGEWVFTFYPKSGRLLKSLKAVLYLVAPEMERTVAEEGEEALQSDIRAARAAILAAGETISATQPWDPEGK